MDVAIIGMSGRFPEAKSIYEFYNNLKEGKDSVRELSRKRLINTSMSLSKEYELLAFLENIDQFDHDFFNISLGEAQHMDPHQRIILEVVYETFEDAGYNPDQFSNSNTAVFIGDVKLEYEKIAEHFDPTLPIGNLNSITAGRISRYFNLRGSSMMVDTACSSSLVAIHLACNELKLGQADKAIVCGVNIRIFPGEKATQYDMGISSPDGKTRSYSSDATGTGSGEVVACVLLKPLAQAIEDYDHIYAVIKGSAVNQDAALSGSLTAPSSAAQSEVIKQAWKIAGVNPKTIGYIEGHGTGTKLGDPIEVQGIDLAFKEFTEDKQFCALSSVKSNIGHTNSSSGISGFIKAVLSLKHKELFPSLHFRTPNPFIDFKNSAVYVNTTLKTWDAANQLRRAGVSSFGISGTNCHVVLEEFVPKVEEASLIEGRSHLFQISAKNSDSLKDYASKLSEYLSKNKSISLKDVGYTLAVGRKSYNHRYACVADSIETLIQSLKSVAPNSKVVKNVEKTVLIFSDKVDGAKQILELLASRYGQFALSLQECKNCIVDGNNDNENTYAFSFQYCFYKLLESKGIFSKLFLGEGIGDLVIKVLTGKTSLNDAFQLATSYQSEKAYNLKTRCENLLKKFEEEGVVFAEIGLNGSIISTLEELKTEDSTFSIVKIDIDDSKDIILEYVKALYEANSTIDWEAFYNQESAKRIELPTYSFTRRRCWLKEIQPDPIKDWLYELDWIRTERTTVQRFQDKTFLVFMDPHGVGESLIRLLELGNNYCIKVYNGEDFEVVSKNTFKIPFHLEDCFVKFKKYLADDKYKISDIIHLGGLSQNTANRVSANIDCTFNTGLHSHFLIAKVFEDLIIKTNISLTIVTNNARRITTGDKIIFSEQSASHGLINSLNEEFPSVKVKVIDVDYLNETIEDIGDQIYNELGTLDSKVTACYRNGNRYIPLIKKVSIDLEKGKSLIEASKTYVVIGGASGMGLEVVKYLASQGSVNIIVLGRTQLPDEAEWDLIKVNSSYPLFETISTFFNIKKRGICLRYFSVDISNLLVLEQTLGEIRSEFGAVNGIIHSAGILDKDPLKNQTVEEFKAGLLAPVCGTINLFQLQSEGLDFFLIFSSCYSFLGQNKLTSHSAGKAFQNSFSQELLRKGIRAKVINWSEWGQTGVFKRQEILTDIENYNSKISNEEGIAIVDLVFSNYEILPSSLVVSKIEPSSFEKSPYFLCNQKEQAVPPAVVEGNHQLESLDKVKEVLDLEVKKNPLWTIYEEKVADIWYEILKRDNLKLEDDFFDLGGHSLNGNQVINRVEKEFGVKLDFDILFDFPTLGSFSKHLEGLLKEEKSIHQPVKIRPIESQEYYEASHAQKRLWLIHQLDTGQNAYNMPLAYYLDRSLDISALAKALKTLVNRHESLRTVFIKVNEDIKQKIISSENFHFNLEYKDLSNANGVQDDISDILNMEALTPFDLENGPLVKAKVFKIDDKGYIFFFSLHHIVGDGWSLEVIIKEVLELYSSYSLGNDLLLPTLNLQYKDYTSWLNNQLSETFYSNCKNYWMKQLSGITASLSLPMDFPRPAVKTYAANKVWFAIDKEKSQQLRELSKEYNTTLFMTLSAILKLLLYKLSSQRDIVIGTPVSSRNHSDLENHIGVFLNTLAIRTKFQGADSFISLLNNVREQVLNGFSNQIYPFDLLIHDLNYSYDRSRNPLFDVGFTFSTLNSLKSLSVNEREKDQNHLNFFPVDHNFHSVKADLWIHVNESEEEIKMAIDYNTDLFKKRTIESMIWDFRALLGSIATNPFSTLDEMIEITREQRFNENKLKQKQFKQKNIASLSAFL